MSEFRCCLLACSTLAKTLVQQWTLLCRNGMPVGVGASEQDTMIVEMHHKQVAGEQLQGNVHMQYVTSLS